MKHFITRLMPAALLIAATACTNDIDHPATNQLDPPEAAIVVGEDFAVISWNAVGNANEYAYSIDGGAEATTTETIVRIDGLQPETTHAVRLKARKAGSIYFSDSDYSEMSFTTTAHVPVYHVATFADDWDTWYYEYNDDWTVRRVYRLWDGQLDREWIFSYDGANLNVTGKNEYTMTLNDKGLVATFFDGWDDYAFTYDDDGYMVGITRNGEPRSNIVVEDGNIIRWSKFSDGAESWKVHTYTSVPNVAGVHCIYSEQCGASRWLVETGLFGKASADCHATNQWDYSEVGSTFSFEYDSNNCIVKETKVYDGYPENFFYTYFAE